MAPKERHSRHYRYRRSVILINTAYMMPILAPDRIGKVFYMQSTTAFRRLRICQQSQAATSAETPPIRNTKPIASFAAAGTWIPARRSRLFISSFPSGNSPSDVLSGALEGAMKANCAQRLASVSAGDTGHGSIIKLTTIEDMNDVMTENDIVSMVQWHVNLNGRSSH